MADFDFLEGFDMDGDWGFTSVKEKPSEEQSKQTETVVKQTAEGTAKAVSSDIVNRLESKLDKVLSTINATFFVLGKSCLIFSGNKFIVLSPINIG